MAPLPSGAYATLRIKSTTNSDSAKSAMGTESVLAKQVGGREILEGLSFHEYLQWARSLTHPVSF